jgi:hypothetical protein
MRRDEIIKRCVDKLGMAQLEAEWVADNLYLYESPDFSEWPWRQIDQCFRDVLFFKGKTEEQILEAIADA